MPKWNRFLRFLLKSARLALGRLCHSSWTEPVRLYQAGWETSVNLQVSPQTLDGLCLGHSGTVPDLSPSHSSDVLAVCLGSSLCREENRCPSFRSRALCSGWLHSSFSLLRPFSLSLPLHRVMMVPPPRSTYRADISQVMSSVLSLLVLRVLLKGVVISSGHHGNDFPQCSQSFKHCLTISKEAIICLLLKAPSIQPLYLKGLINWVLLRSSFQQGPPPLQRTSEALFVWPLGFNHLHCSRKSPDASKLLPFHNYRKHTVLLWKPPKL